MGSSDSPSQDSSSRKEEESQRSLRRLLLSSEVLCALLTLYMGSFYALKNWSEIERAANRVTREAVAAWVEFCRGRVLIEYDFDAAAVMTCRVNGRPVPVTGKPGSDDQFADTGPEIKRNTVTIGSETVYPIISVVTRVDETVRWLPVIGSLCGSCETSPYRVLLKNPVDGSVREMSFDLGGDRTPADLWATISADADEYGLHSVEFTRGRSYCGESRATRGGLAACIADFVRAERQAGRIYQDSSAQVIFEAKPTLSTREAADQVLLMKTPEVTGVTWTLVEESEVADEAASNESSFPNRQARRAPVGRGTPSPVKRAAHPVSR